MDKLLPVVRDVVCLALGAYGFVWQVTHGGDPILMGGCILTLGGPAVMAAWSQARSGGGPAETPTTGSSPSSPSPPSLPPASPSSSPAGAEP